MQLTMSPHFGNSPVSVNTQDPKRAAGLPSPAAMTSGKDTVQFGNLSKLDRVKKQIDYDHYIQDRYSTVMRHFFAKSLRQRRNEERITYFDIAEALPEIYAGKLYDNPDGVKEAFLERFSYFHKDEAERIFKDITKPPYSLILVKKGGGGPFYEAEISGELEIFLEMYRKVREEVLRKTPH